jgi:S1-C subfamily serine protease
MRTLSLLLLTLFLIGPNGFSKNAPLTQKEASLTCDRGFLGIETSQMSIDKANFLELPNPYGSYVTKVYPNSAADEAGLKAFDYIVGVNEDMLDDEHDLSDYLRNHEPGDAIVLRVIRAGKPLDLDVRLGKMTDFSAALDPIDRPFFGVSKTGPMGAGTGGVMVNVVSKSNAAEMGLRDGDIIKEINGHKMYDWSDVSAAIKATPANEDVRVKISRNGETIELQGTMGSFVATQEEKMEAWGEAQAEKWEAWGEQQAEKWERRSERFEDNFKRKWENRFDGSRPFLGIYLEKISERKAELLGFDNPYGSYVSGVIPNTAAAKAGVQPFDYIYGFETYRVGADQGLGDILSKYEPGDQGTLHIFRKGARKTLGVTLGTRLDAAPKKVNKCDSPFFGVRNSYGSNVDELGVRISPVANSTAASIGLMDGDVIYTINGHKIIDWTDVGIAIDNATPGKPITVEYGRDGKKGKATGNLKTLGETKECEENEWDITDDFDIEMNFDFDESTIVNQSPRRGSDRNDRPDISDMKISVQNVSENEAREFNSKSNQNFSARNTLDIRDLRLSPNPNEGMFKLDFELPGNGETQVKIFNNSGRAIYEYDLGNYSGTFQDQVDISQNGKGQYYLEIRQGNKTALRKIILQ